MNNLNNINNLQEKIAQMLILGFDGTSINKNNNIIRKEITDNKIGGVILFDYNFKSKSYDKNIKNPEQVKNLIIELNNCNQNNSIPLFIAVDYEGGKVNRLSSKYGFRETMTPEKFATLDINSAEQEAKAMAEQLKQLGFNLNFAPLVDLAINKNNPIIAELERSFSNDPVIVTKYADILAKAHLDQNILCCYKHFPGHGSSTSDSHLGFVDVTHTWQNIELEPYKDLVNNLFYKNNIMPAIMTAHIINKNLDNSGLPATMSKKIITDLLINELNYSGLIISDDLQMKAITDLYSIEEALIKTINAGVDMLIIGNQLAEHRYNAENIINLIVKNINNNNISLDNINKSYTKIQNIKKLLIN